MLFIYIHTIDKKQIASYLPYVCTVEHVCNGHLWTSNNCTDYQCVLIFHVILYEKVTFGTSTKCTCLDYAGVQVSTLTGFTVHMYMHLCVKEMRMILMMTPRVRHSFTSLNMCLSRKVHSIIGRILT